ncbi:glycoside hydrolase [Astrocystis sublimbata]|nr:glycoside hydrolase [Astrocystis sublimbata]
MKNLSLLALAALAPVLSMAHYHFPHLIINGQVTGAHEYVREHDNGYMPSWSDGAFLNSNDLRCNKGSQNHMRQPKTAKVTAGKDEIGFATNVHAHIQHPGPLQIYLSKAPGDVRDYDGSGDWFKVYQIGHQDGSTADKAWLSWDKEKFTFKLPKEIPAGQYLMRIEHIATHQPYTGREFFLQCAHIEVVSDYNGASPKDTFKIPGVYNRNQPFFKYDSWANPQPTVCPMPGGSMWPNNNNYNHI